MSCVRLRLCALIIKRNESRQISKYDNQSNQLFLKRTYDNIPIKIIKVYIYLNIYIFIYIEKYICINRTINTPLSHVNEFDL